MKITIDGPVASGKTAVGRALARRIPARFLDTGMMYRAITWASIRQQIDFDNEAALSELTKELSIEVILEDGEQILKVNGIDVTDELRHADIESNVSKISRIGEVRSELVNQQRDIASTGDIVMVGRDIGTVVIPEADLKIYLDASIQIRAKRRHDEMRRKGHRIDLEKLVEEIKTRDNMDSNRKDSPLMSAKDAVIINTDRLRIDQVVNLILESIKKS
ncbi:MAG: cytidylate kinase [Dehalococcoidia bacterium]|nr:cytidylate kinase [Dehalococcoidia bacterium]MQG15703.1 (d)CMP kinase [SAR202 cluster bacterium]|tara:strand:+ start:24628 stop:25284 length:657 start_codon:yes stop_codon:yes gene_type:complete